MSSDSIHIKLAAINFPLAAVRARVLSGFFLRLPVAMASEPLFCPICLTKSPQNFPPLYPRCVPFHSSALLPNQPTTACLQPGDDVCALSSTQFTSLTLVCITPYNHDTSIFEFALPEPHQLLCLRPFTHLIVRAPGKQHDGRDAERAYTSISDPLQRGSFCLMVKRYAEWGVPMFVHSYKPKGAVSNFLHQLRVGDAVDFRLNAAAHVRLRLPFSSAGIRKVTMVCVGAGVAPFIQLLRNVLTSEQDHSVDLTLIYGNRSVRDILQRELLISFARMHSNFRLVLVVGSRYANVRMHYDNCPPKCKLVHLPPAPENWHELDVDAADGVLSREQGWIDETVLAKHAHPPNDDTRVIVCGLPAVYEAICGPRLESGLSKGSYLANLGYADHMIVKM
jgi:cytochrome-b5 reductase